MQDFLAASSGYYYVVFIAEKELPADASSPGWVDREHEINAHAQLRLGCLGDHRGGRECPRLRVSLSHCSNPYSPLTRNRKTFSHFEQLIDEHRQMTNELVTELNPNSAPGVATVASANLVVPSRLKQLIPGVGTFYTRLPLRKAFEAYNAKYGVTKRKVGLAVKSSVPIPALTGTAVHMYQF